LLSSSGGCVRQKSDSLPLLFLWRGNPPFLDYGLKPCSAVSDSGNSFFSHAAVISFALQLLSTTRVRFHYVNDSLCSCLPIIFVVTVPRIMLTSLFLVSMLPGYTILVHGKSSGGGWHFVGLDAFCGMEDRAADSEHVWVEGRGGPSRGGMPEM